MNDGTLRLLRICLGTFLAFTIIAVLRATSVITVPVALAVFTLILAWPLQRNLERLPLHRNLCYILTLLSIFAVSAVFVGILYLCAQNVAATAPNYEERFARLSEQLKSWSNWPDTSGRNQERPLSELASKLLDAIPAIFTGAYGLLGLFALTVTFLVLGLIEIHAFQAKLRYSLSPTLSAKVLEAGKEVSSMLQRYMLARTIVSGTTGLFVGLFTWFIGLDFPLVWAVSSFLLNYIPMLGSIIAVIPPTLVAFLHPNLWLGIVTLTGLTLIQFTIGNYVDPKIEGRILSLSPFVLLFSILFWGWVWGIPGALLAIPITASIVIFLRKFDDSRWLARLVQRESN